MMDEVKHTAIIEEFFDTVRGCKTLDEAKVRTNMKSDEFIKTIVNSHDELVAALKCFVHQFRNNQPCFCSPYSIAEGHTGRCLKARAALGKVKQ
jgi:hypothetical protein